MKRGSHQRIDISFNEEIDKIRINRIVKGIDKPTKQISFRKVTEMLPRHTLWPKIREDLINLDVKKIRGVNR